MLKTYVCFVVKASPTHKRLLAIPHMGSPCQLSPLSARILTNKQGLRTGGNTMLALRPCDGESQGLVTTQDIFLSSVSCSTLYVGPDLFVFGLGRRQKSAHTAVCAACLPPRFQAPDDDR